MNGQTVKQPSTGPTCDKCGAEMVFNPRTGKQFCASKCWLNEKNENGYQKTIKQPQTDFVTYQGNKQYNRPKADTTSFKVSYAKDLLIAMIEHASASKNEKFDVVSASQLSMQIIGAMYDVFQDKQ